MFKEKIKYNKVNSYIVLEKEGEEGKKKLRGVRRKGIKEGEGGVQRDKGGGGDEKNEVEWEMKEKGKKGSKEELRKGNWKK